MRNILILTLILLFPNSLIAQNLPSDVRPNHWATPSVKSVLQNGVLPLIDGKNFRGDAKVTRTQAINAIAKLAHVLDANQWKATPSIAIPAKAEKLSDQPYWKKQPITRYAFARILARMGDYVQNGVKRASSNDKDTSKSVAIPPKPTLKLASTHPAYASLTYLVSHRMIFAGSPFLTPNDTPVQAEEVAIGLAQMLTGWNDKITPLGHDAEGSTPDRSFHKPH